jgi:hypothetical protein
MTAMGKGGASLFSDFFISGSVSEGGWTGAGGSDFLGTRRPD